MMLTLGCQSKHFFNRHTYVVIFLTLIKRNNIMSLSTTPAPVNTAPVVNSSVTPSSKTSKKANSSTDQIMMNKLDDLINQRQDWENNELAKCNERLYDILTECYALFQSINGTDPKKTALKRSFDRVAKDREFNFLDSQHYTARVVSIVFNDKTQTRRISRYAKAQCIATYKEIPVNDLKDFFYKNGGIDEIRKKSKTGIPTMKSHVKGRAILHRSPITTIVDPKLAKKIPASNHGLPVILVANYKENSKEFEIMGVTQKNTGATKMVFSSFAQSIDENSPEYAKLKAEIEVNDQDEIQDDDDQDDA